eukprot:GEMP01074259.1.p2 GENE.GEMP01074259.1~~GEMP01074259.1.p2  ORF type:complete len:119 (+),score=6.23 GEMP01074259.1:23-358(+)
MDTVTRTMKFKETMITFYLIRLDGQSFIWVGDQKLEFEDLHVSFPSNLPGIPPISTLLGTEDSSGSGICQKLTAHFKYPIYLSFNLTDPEPDTLIFVQKELKQMLSTATPA